MKKSAIERSISKRAASRFDKEWQELNEFLRKHPIAKELKIIGNGKTLHLVSGNDYRNNDSIITSYQDDTIVKDSSNLVDIRADLIEKYEAEEVKNLESKLDSVRYIFERGGI